MTEKERYDWDLKGIWDYNDESDEYIESYEDITKLLNEQEETIQRLKQIREEQIQTILKQKRKIKELEEENEQLKKEYKKLKHRHSLLHDVCIEAECDREGYHKDVLSLEKENEQLKQEGANVERLIDDLGSEELRRQYEEIINGDNDD